MIWMAWASCLKGLWSGENEVMGEYISTYGRSTLMYVVRLPVPAVHFAANTIIVVLRIKIVNNALPFAALWYAALWCRYRMVQVPYGAEWYAMDYDNSNE